MNGIILAVQQMHVWDVLRPLVELAEEFNFPIKVLVLLLSLAFLVIAFLAFKRSKSNKFLFVTIAFGLFFLKWLLKVFDVYVSPGYFFSDPVENVFELLILVSLFLALFRKSK